MKRDYWSFDFDNAAAAVVVDDANDDKHDEVHVVAAAVDPVDAAADAAVVDIVHDDENNDEHNDDTIADIEHDEDGVDDLDDVDVSLHLLLQLLDVVDDDYPMKTMLSGVVEPMPMTNRYSEVASL